jgi:hypothetical protein
MATAAAILKAVAAAFTVAPWLRTTAFVLIAFSFGFIKGCNTGRSWAKQPEPPRVVRPERPKILPWRQAEAEPALPQLPPIADRFVEPTKTIPVQTKQTQRAANCAGESCSTGVRRGLFGRWR